MKKRVLAVLVVGLVSATTACAISPAQRAKYERSGCTQVSELQGCDLNKSYEWNQRHGFITSNDERPQHQGRHHHDNAYNDQHDAAGINGKFVGNYVAKFGNGQRGADIHVEDSGVYLNGKEMRDTNVYNDTLTFRDGYATYTLNANHHGSWRDEYAGNSGSIQYIR